MGKFQDIIVINGKTYDVRNRTLNPRAKTIAPAPKRKNIDGFIAVNTITKKVRATKSIPKPVRPTKIPQSTPSRSVHHVAPHRAEKSKILMRSGLRKPRLAVEKKTTSFIAPQSIKIDKRRSQRAKTIPKSNLVKKFNNFTEHTAFKQRTLAVQPLSSTPPTKEAKKTSSWSTDIIPSRSIASSVATMTVSQSESLFQKAMQESKQEVYQPSHKHTRRNHKAKKVLKFSSAFAIFLVIAGFLVLHNLPQLYIKLASSKAGFAANLPEYQPAGFRLQRPIEADPGQVSIRYVSQSDDRNFSIVQKASNWNSKSLLENFIHTNNKDYQTIEDGGKTIFLYDSNSATWVSGGVWYQLTGINFLNNEQIINIANSLQSS